MSRTIEAITAHVVRAAEQPVALTYEINLTACWQTALETTFGNTRWKVRMDKIESTRKRMISVAGVLILLAFVHAAVASDVPDAGDEKALQEQNDGFVAAFNRGDIKAVIEAYAPTAIFSRQRAKG